MDKMFGRVAICLTVILLSISRVAADESTVTTLPRTTKLSLDSIFNILGKAGNTFLHRNETAQPTTNSTNGHNNVDVGMDLSKLFGNQLQPLQMLLGDPSKLNPSTIWAMALQYIKLMVTSLGSEGVNKPCLDDLKLILDGLNRTEIWALKMVDAMGKIPSSLLSGNFKWLGDMDECERVTANVDGEDRFTGKFCRAEIALDFMPDFLKAVGGGNAILGTCVPNQCSSNDLRIIMSSVFKVSPIKLSVDKTECLEPKALKSDAIAVICVLSILGSMVFFGTVYDIVAVQMKSDKPKPEKDDIFQNPNHKDPTVAIIDGKVGYMYDMTPMKENGSLPFPKPDVTASTPTQSRRSVMKEVLLSFSVYTNGCKMLSTKQGAGTLTSINGIRFLSMCWVILGHTMVFAFDEADNLAGVYMVFVNRFSFNAIMYATVSVDSFFTLSGTLVAYLTLKELKKLGGPKKLNWLMFYFHRFWRLTPPYMLVLMVGTVLLPYFVSGALAPTGYEMEFMNWCRKSWWTNLLYINNYVKTDQPCMGWSWYLANDMQFYIISPLILLPLFYNVVAGSVSSLMFMVATLVTTGVITHQHHYLAQRYPGLPEPEDDKYFFNVYAPSYARMGPYIVGLLAGYLLYRLQCKCRIPKVLNVSLWLTSFVICCLCVYGPDPNEGKHLFTNLEADVYTALARTGWGVAVAWIIFACATGNGGWINEVLSWSPFVPLGRMTYCAYLIHPLLMSVYYRSKSDPIHFTNFDVIYMFLGNTTLTYGAAFLVSLVFESPMMGLEKAIFRKKK